MSSAATQIQFEIIRHKWDKPGVQRHSSYIKNKMVHTSTRLCYRNQTWPLCPDCYSRNLEMFLSRLSSPVSPLLHVTLSAQLLPGYKHSNNLPSCQSLEISTSPFLHPTFHESVSSFTGLVTTFMYVFLPPPRLSRNSIISLPGIIKYCLIHFRQQCSHLDMESRRNETAECK